MRNQSISFQFFRFSFTPPKAFSIRSSSSVFRPSASCENGKGSVYLQILPKGLSYIDLIDRRIDPDLNHSINFRCSQGLLTWRGIWGHTQENNLTRYANFFQRRCQMTENAGSCWLAAVSIKLAGSQVKWVIFYTSRVSHLIQRTFHFTIASLCSFSISKNSTKEKRGKHAAAQTLVAD